MAARGCSCRHLLFTCVVFFSFFFSCCLNSFPWCGITRVGCFLRACLSQLCTFPSISVSLVWALSPAMVTPKPPDPSRVSCPIHSTAHGSLKHPLWAPSPLEAPSSGTGWQHFWFFLVFSFSPGQSPVQPRVLRTSLPFWRVALRYGHQDHPIIHASCDAQQVKPPTRRNPASLVAGAGHGAAVGVNKGREAQEDFIHVYQVQQP